MNDEQMKELFLIHHSAFILHERRLLFRFHAHSPAFSILTFSWPRYILAFPEEMKEPNLSEPVQSL